MVSTWNSTPAEAASAIGKFYFSRGATAGDLVVNYAVSGTAVNGSDYTALTGTITIPDTLSGADLTITPVNDALAEGSESVTVTVLPGAGYGPEIPDTATLWIGKSCRFSLSLRQRLPPETACPQTSPSSRPAPAS